MTVDGPLVSNDVGAALDACVRGLGFGLFLSYQVEPLVTAGKLRVVLDAYEPAAVPVSLVYPHARLVAPRVRALVDWLKDALRTGR